MTASRAESQSQPHGRRRSNTAQSILRQLPPPPLELGDSKVLNLWVHDIKESPTVILNQSWWPGVAEGDMLHVKTTNSGDKSSGFLFSVPKDEGCSKPTLQISLPKNVAAKFGMKNNGEVTITKVDKEKYSADYVEFTFQDQYLGRNEMWRLSEHLVGQCVFVDQEISFIGVIAAKVKNIYAKGQKLSAGYVTSHTKAIYRSLSAKVTIFIQVCRELWEFAGDGERYNEKIVHSFLPSLFAKWREAGTNHTVTIVLISRVYYEATEIDYAAGPLRRDEDGKWYKDFYKVITDLEIIHDWKPTLVGLKDSFWDFQRDILLTHHYHRSSVESAIGPPEQVRLVGHLSYAHDGPILEALNLGLNPNETHYIDRSLSLTGASTILITPGTGYYRVPKELLRLTTTRMLDQGFGLDLVSLAKRPLHQSPIFSFQGLEPDRDGKNGARANDPLWGGDEDPKETIRREKKTFWWEPFWITVSFWDRQMDLPFREDRFVARAKMHEIQMLGLLEHDVLSSIEVPFLPEKIDPYATPPRDTYADDTILSKYDADQADLETFTPTRRESRPSNITRTSYTSSGSGTMVTASYRSSIISEKRYASHRNSVASRIAPIEESPRRIIMELPPEGDHSGLIPSVTGMSTSPSQSSMRSVRSNRSLAPSVSTTTSTERPNSEVGISRISKLAPSWLFYPFRSSSTESQANSAPSSATGSTTPTQTPSMRVPIASNPSATPSSSISRSPQPMAIIHSSGRSTLSRTYEDDSTLPHRGSFPRHSPLNSPPRDDATFGRRRSMILNSMTLPFSSSSPISSSRTDPSRPESTVSYTQSSLARRWQHVFPTPLYKHQVKWKSMVTPGCLPLTVEHFPSVSELEFSYDVFSYDFVVDPPEMRSFLVQSPHTEGTSDDIRRAWALVVMRGMVAVRLAQGFQFVLRPQKIAEIEEKTAIRRTKSFMGEDDETPKPSGAAEILRSTHEPVYVSMSNEIHRISYAGEAIQVRRQPYEYQCLIWPKLGIGYTELATKFTSHGLENYGWNRLDMLVAGYEHQFSDSLRYWRTRFVVIPTAEPPLSNTGPSNEKLNEEEIRLMGIDKLAEIFSKLRWQPPEERGMQMPPVRFLPTTFGPAISVLDDSLMSQLDEIHATGPLKKKMKSERDIADMPLAAIAKAMREDDSCPIKLHIWHGSKYPDSFTGFDFVSWLVREFRDVSSREQGAEWGTKLWEQGLFTHCRGLHGFLDGHYFYYLKGEYAVASTPRGWFTGRSLRYNGDEYSHPRSYYPASTARLHGASPKRNKKRLILSQSMVIDIDPGKKSDQAEPVILHHDVIQNPETVFHFELQWIGTTARCIEDMLRQWSRTIERYGLKLVEAYVTEISDIRDRNAFQSCFPMRPIIPPPVVPDLEKRIPEGAQVKHYFEYAILKHHGFIIDIEASDLYPEQVDVVYSYRRAPFKYSQFVHRSGVAFVQVLGGSQGFLFLTNRLMGPGRMGTKSKDYRPAAAADDVRTRLQQFCQDRIALMKFYDEELDKLAHAPEEPPPLSI
ncbi:hypothetical protein SERLA73DRAFT_162510 [Serpula lacrymans var. lacrymans S7.3]|uniref:Vacuolar membrane-associated protein IML1 n=2 Tax=Serpula lacrymans var. lacrymans TaxID=341189 RepID=F8Q870_SERL3|nr:uncharacterized protein SERLADRAFT_417615 [Serpula lacrymans var. lacrymans S7.9]EGN95758.1 hypothetical protein SERLA73DRAFT_162510 [Serpula lacrymans var. lacrymans S7.3]EGO21283.1 hypothetical protein SERLADRAFT_417615 [Serpula lacrymans var. lacrymans S7.9]